MGVGYFYDPAYGFSSYKSPLSSQELAHNDPHYHSYSTWSYGKVHDYYPAYGTGYSPYADTGEWNSYSFAGHSYN